MNNIIQINLGKKGYAILDKEMSYLAKNRWYKDTNGYARRYEYINGKQKVYQMHREVLGMKLGNRLWVDHINGDRLDNRKTNLRIVTVQQSAMNRRKVDNSTSKFKGVYWHKTNKIWQALIKLNGKIQFLGNFKNEFAAAKRYNLFAKKYFGDYAKLNLVD